MAVISRGNHTARSELDRYLGYPCTRSEGGLNNNCIPLFRTEQAQHAKTRRLPEPPQLRDRLKQEISFFVTNLHQFQGANALYVHANTHANDACVY